MTSLRPVVLPWMSNTIPDMMMMANPSSLAMVKMIWTRLVNPVLMQLQRVVATK